MAICRSPGPCDETKSLRMPQERFSRGGWLLLVSRFFDHAYAHRRSARCEVIRPLRTENTVWTLPSLWTHRTRPQGTWKTAQTAVFHSAHTDHFFLTRGTRTTENAASVPIRLSQQRGSPQPSVPWAVPLTAAYLCAFWWYLRGGGPPDST